MGWTEAADLIVKGMEGAINAKTVTYDFERLMEGAKLLKCSEFGDAIIKTCNHYMCLILQRAYNTPVVLFM